MTDLAVLGLAALPSFEPRNPLDTALLLAMISVLPFVLMMTTTFLKFSVVLSIVRTALGTQQVPPTPVVMGLSLILTMYAMAPIGIEVYDEIKDVLPGKGASGSVIETIKQAREPVRKFLVKHAHEDEVAVFLLHARDMKDPETAEEIRDDNLMVLVPAFAISELTEAFAIGFLIFLPFLIIDMAVSNILLAMGMFMLPPTIVSLPFKLLLFIMVDGWRMLAEGLLDPYLL